MLCWGWSQYGQCGVVKGTVGAASSIPEGGPGTCSDASASAFDSVMVDEEGTVYRCGRQSTSEKLVRVCGLSRLGRVTRVSAGRQFALAVLVDCRVACWGANLSGECGSRECGAFVKAEEPLVVAGIKAREASCGAEFSVVVSPEGTASSWGSVEHGQLGRPGDSEPRALDCRRAGLGALVNAACGDHHALVVDASGRVATFGLEDFGRLGRRGDPRVPGRVRYDASASIVVVAAGGASSASVDSRGCLFTWGCNGSGQLGVGDARDRSAPTRAALPSGTTCCGVDVGEDHACAVDDDGVLWAWGSGRSDRLSKSATSTTTTTPIRVAVAGADGRGVEPRVNRVAAGGAHSIAWRCPRPLLAVSTALSEQADARDYADAVAVAVRAAADAFGAASRVAAEADDACSAVYEGQKRQSRLAVERKRLVEERRRRDRDDERRRDAAAADDDDALSSLLRRPRAPSGERPPPSPEATLPVRPPPSPRDCAARSVALTSAAARSLESPRRETYDWASLQAEFATVAKATETALRLADDRLASRCADGRLERRPVPGAPGSRKSARDHWLT